ncbi:MAG: ATP-binding protein [Armatimonadetes bacterium]|nr:ATP-binding protein [Armatimonadota bacterium]
MHRAKGLVTAELGLSEEAVFACRLAISEAVANAFEHGQRDGTFYCRVRVERETGLIRIAVEDRGYGFRWQGLSASMPSPEEEHGRGVHLIRLLMDGVSILSTPEGTCIEMVKVLTGAGG